jgi:hypothetical protein
MKTHHWIIGILILLVLFLIIGSIPGTGGSRTYAETAQVYKQECIRAKGYGEWRGSSGVPLDNFCELAGVVRARKEMCAEYPEDC